MCALGVVQVPGLPEGSPAVVPGHVVYLRMAPQPESEFPAVVAGVEGSTCFLHMAHSFWEGALMLPLVSGVLVVVPSGAICACRLRSRTRRGAGGSGSAIHWARADTGGEHWQNV